MKRTYVKVANIETGLVYDNWFLKYSIEDAPLDGQIFQKNLIQGEFKKLMDSKSEREMANFQTRLAIVSRNSPNYFELAHKYKQTLLIRQIGSYMFLTDGFVVTDICQSESWPTDNAGAEIVICENDLNAEPDWLLYLQTNFPDKKINVLNDFRHRNSLDVTEHFEKAQYITFYTTFTNLDWFELLMDSVANLKGKVIVGYCVIGTAWNDVFKLFGDRIKTFTDNGNEFKIIKTLT